MEDENNSVENNYEEKRKEENRMLCRAAINIVKLTLNRYSNVQDPVLRHALLVDKLLLFVDIGLGAGKEYIQKEIGDECAEEFENVSLILQNDLKLLMDWIQTPSYSPDHPFGNNMMKQSNDNYSQKQNCQGKHDL